MVDKKIKRQMSERTLHEKLKTGQYELGTSRATAPINQPLPFDSKGKLREKRIIELARELEEKLKERVNIDVTQERKMKKLKSKSRQVSQ